MGPNLVSVQSGPYITLQISYLLFMILGINIATLIRKIHPVYLPSDFTRV